MCVCMYVCVCVYVCMCVCVYVCMRVYIYDGYKKLFDKTVHKKVACAIACANLAETCAPTHPTNNGS